MQLGTNFQGQEKPVPLGPNVLSEPPGRRLKAGLVGNWTNQKPSLPSPPSRVPASFGGRSCYLKRPGRHGCCMVLEQKL